jgi:hypothetical protein
MALAAEKGRLLRSVLRLCVCLLALVALSSCRSAGIKRAYMSLDSDGKRKRDVFFTDTETMFCVAEIASGREDLSVGGVWRATSFYSSLDGSKAPVNSVLAIEEEAPGAGEDVRVFFELFMKDGDRPYPAGTFVCDLSLDGEVEESLAFEVQFPACPAAPLFSGLVCRDFVIGGSVCPGATSGTNCTCAESGLWECG